MACRCRPPPGSPTSPPNGTSFEVGTPVAFAGTGSDPEGNPLTFTWTFADGKGASGASPAGYRTLARLRAAGLSARTATEELWLVAMLGVGSVFLFAAVGVFGVAAVGFACTSTMAALLGWVEMPSALLIFVMSLGGLLNGIIQPSRDMMVRRLREGVEFFQFLKNREDMIVS